SAILGCVGCLVGHLFMFLVGGKTPDQSVHLNLTTTMLISAGLECKNGPPWRSVAMNLVPGLGLTPQALNSARAALAPKG
ncbi:hypothetical protein L6M77_15305, partial [Klebsiella pneumoniae]|nr:hypothetical protein [Klebsiella pneumoniae]